MRRLCPSWVKMTAIAALACIVGACAPSMTGESLLDKRLEAAPAASATQKQARLNAFMQSQSASAGKSSFEGFVQPGNDRLTGKAILQGSQSFDQEGEDVTLNLLNVSVAQAAKSVLGDTARPNLQRRCPRSGNGDAADRSADARTRLLDLFEATLRDNGAVIVAGNGSYRIVPLVEAGRTTASISTSRSASDEPGIKPQLVPLRYVSADNMRQVSEPMLPAGMILNVDAERNALILSGTPRGLLRFRKRSRSSTSIGCKGCRLHSFR